MDANQKKAYKARIKRTIENLEKNADKRWNICTEADEMVVSAEGNTVFFVMSPSKFEE